MYNIQFVYRNSLMHAKIVYHLNLIYIEVICFKSLHLEQVTSKYSERLYLCLNNYHCKLNSKFNQWFHSLNITECTLGCQYISVTLYLLQTYYPSGKPLLKGQGSVDLKTYQKILIFKFGMFSDFEFTIYWKIISDKSDLQLQHPHLF